MKDTDLFNKIFTNRLNLAEKSVLAELKYFS